MKTVELLELNDEELLSLIGATVVIRLTGRPFEEMEPDEDGEIPVPEDRPFKTVVAVGTLIELQFSSDTGGAIAYVYSGGPQPDELRWDSHEYRGEITWQPA